MGSHYVPKAHLLRFATTESPESVVMYDKKTGRFATASAKSLAQERNYYDPEVEIALANDVELRANSCVTKLTNHQSLNNEERTQLSLYMMTMSTRGPRHRRKSVAVFDQARLDVIRDARTAADNGMGSKQITETEYAELIAEIDRIDASYAKCLPDELIALHRTPFWTEKTVAAVYNMHWHVVAAQERAFFITSDTPVHYFEWLGVGNEDSEFTFPLSSQVALVGNRKRASGVSYHIAMPNVHREINRRIASVAERFLFSCKQEPWIASVGVKKDHYLSRIQWQYTDQ